VAQVTNYMAAERQANAAFYAAEVAKAAFPYPNDEHPDRSWHVNLPEITVEVPLPERGAVVAPDIVVLEGSDKTAVFCGEVIMFKDDMEVEVETRWRPASRVSTLVVFVPVGNVKEAKQLIRRTKVNCLLYSYRWTPMGVDVSPVP